MVNSDYSGLIVMERELLLLGLLRRQEMHGYELHDFIERYMQTCVDLKKPTAYYLLDKMAKAGLVMETEAQSGNRPPRRVYHITPAGEQYFQELLRDNLTTYHPAQFGGLVGLVFLDEINADEARPLLEQRRAVLVTALDTVRQVPPHPGSMQFVIEHQIMHLEHELNWLDTVLTTLEE